MGRLRIIGEKKRNLFAVGETKLNEKSGKFFNEMSHNQH